MTTIRKPVKAAKPAKPRDYAKALYGAAQAAAELPAPKTTPLSDRFYGPS